MTIVISILLIGLLIVIHEFGHFITAKLSGVQVNEFSIFMGPAIAKWERGGTLYSIRCIPLGGYCAMEGEDQETDSPNSFQKAAWWKRLLILIAGSLANFLAGVLLVAVLLSCQPQYGSTQVASIESWSKLSESAQLQPGDTILEFDGKKIRIYEDFMLATVLAPDGNYDMTVLRNGQKLQLKDVPMERVAVEKNGVTQRLYGLTFQMKQTTAESVPGRILPTAFYHVRSVAVSLKALITGQAQLGDMMGMVGLVHVMSESAESASSAGYAALNMLEFGVFLAINLAVMNLLPIPALDGGRVVALLLTTVIEAITRKKIDPKYEGYVHSAGMVLLLALMGLIMFKDIFTIFKG